MAEEVLGQNEKPPSTLTLDRLPHTIVLDRIENNNNDMVEGGIKLEFTMLDQTMLPSQEIYLRTSNWREVIDAIKLLQVRGAPALGIAGAAAVALCAAELATTDDFEPLNCKDASLTNDKDENAKLSALYLSALEQSAREISQARPTAVNLERECKLAFDIAREHLDAGDTPRMIVSALYDFTKELEREDEACNRAIGNNGATLLKEPSTVLTHCNAGSLATAFYGTALGIVYSAAKDRNIKRVYADETRPLGQGARLTTWELSHAGIPVTLICDNMAADIMAQATIDAIFVGADRIAANGDTANKIGTYGLAVLAYHHKVPFYVAAPSSTLDFTLETGKDIPIEQRDASEVLPEPIEGVDVYNPAFDITPANLITKIITERGVFEPNELMKAYKLK